MPRRSRYVRRAKRKIRRNLYPSAVSRTLRLPSVYLFKMRLASTLTTDITGLINARIQVSNLSSHWWTSGAAAGSALLETTNLKALFDNYLVQSVNIKFTPSYNSVSDSGITGGNAAVLGSIPNLFIAYDPDNAGGPGSLNKVLTSEKVTSRSMLKPFSKRYKIQKVFQGTTGQPMLANGYNNLQDENNNNSGVIWIRSDFPVQDGSGAPIIQERIGTVFIETIVRFKNRN